MALGDRAAGGPPGLLEPVRPRGVVPAPRLLSGRPPPRVLAWLRRGLLAPHAPLPPGGRGRLRAGRGPRPRPPRPAGHRRGVLDERPRPLLPEPLRVPPGPRALSAGRAAAAPGGRARRTLDRRRGHGPGGLHHDHGRRVRGPGVPGGRVVGVGGDGIPGSAAPGRRRRVGDRPRRGARLHDAGPAAGERPGDGLRSRRDAGQRAAPCCAPPGPRPQRVRLPGRPRRGVVGRCFLHQGLPVFPQPVRGAPRAVPGGRRAAGGAAAGAARAGGRGAPGPVVRPGRPGRSRSPGPERRAGRVSVPLPEQGAAPRVPGGEPLRGAGRRCPRPGRALGRLPDRAPGLCGGRGRPGRPDGRAPRRARGPNGRFVGRGRPPRPRGGGGLHLGGRRVAGGDRAGRAGPPRPSARHPGQRVRHAAAGRGPGAGGGRDEPADRAGVLRAAARAGRAPPRPPGRRPGIHVRPGREPRGPGLPGRQPSGPRPVVVLREPPDGGAVRERAGPGGAGGRQRRHVVRAAAPRAGPGGLRPPALPPHRRPAPGGRRGPGAEPGPPDGPGPHPAGPVGERHARPRHPRIRAPGRSSPGRRGLSGPTGDAAAHVPGLRPPHRRRARPDRGGGRVRGPRGAGHAGQLRLRLEGLRRRPAGRRGACPRPLPRRGGPPGRSRVALRYHPPGLRTGALIAGASAVAVALFALRRKGPSPGTST